MFVNDVPLELKAVVRGKERMFSVSSLMMAILKKRFIFEKAVGQSAHDRTEECCHDLCSVQASA